jgi:plastocyanin
VEVTAQIETSPVHARSGSQIEFRSPAAIWLVPLHPTVNSTPVNTGSYTLLQKNKQFTPHLLVVPVGAVVHFPNADPFFHNVFSLFDGRRFDLGLYEAGASREVTFGREGISYIFCNIHPEMSAVVIALNTPYFAVAEPKGGFRIQGVPPQDYLLHVWAQGVDQATLTSLTRRVHISADHADLGIITLPQPPTTSPTHEKNMTLGSRPCIEVFAHCARRSMGGRAQLGSTEV